MTIEKKIVLIGVVIFALIVMYTVYKEFKEENERLEESIANKKQKLDLNEIVDEGLQKIFQPLIDKAVEEVLSASEKGKDTYELDLQSIIQSNDKDRYNLFKRQLRQALEDEYKNTFTFYARWNYTMMFIKWM